MELAFGNTPIPLDVSDPLAYVGGAVLLAAAAMAAMLGPARRAGMTDPMQALRHE